VDDDEKMEAAKYLYWLYREAYGVFFEGAEECVRDSVMELKQM
jgi:hypothetical protein